MQPLQALLPFLLLALCASFTISQFQQADLSASVLAYRKLVIRDNLNLIRKYNEDQTNTVRLAAHAQFIGNTLEENIQKFISKAPLLEMKQVETPAVQASLTKKLVTGSSLDLSGYTYPVYNQALCGNCYAYAVVNSINAQRFIMSGRNYSALSIQEMTDCSSQSHLMYRNFGCGGGDLQYSLWYATWYGLHTQDNYPFNLNSLNKGESQACQSVGRAPGFKIRGWGVVGYEYNCITRAVLVLNGYTVPTAIYGGHAAFFYYASGIFTSCPTPPANRQIDHAVLIVGYTYDGTFGGSNLKVKNSWGTTWGINGFFYIAMTGNVCNVCSYSTYAFV